tara:strand:+ start:93 stop:281 length:189 start_codon:yes stop_codon:yes gene_type:complete
MARTQIDFGLVKKFHFGAFDSRCLADIDKIHMLKKQQGNNINVIPLYPFSRQLNLTQLDHNI